MSDLVLLERRDTVATVTLNNPARRNSLSDDMLTALGRALAELRDDATTRVVILTGATPIFSAGADAPFARACRRPSGARCSSPARASSGGSSSGPIPCSRGWSR